jgi:hypothetical protein
VPLYRIERVVKGGEIIILKDTPRETGTIIKIIKRKLGNSRMNVALETEKKSIYWLKIVGLKGNII